MSVPWTTAIAWRTATWPTVRPRPFRQRATATAAATIPTSIQHSRPAPIREDAPTRIFCFIEDLFFLAKIQETARKLGVKVEFIKGDKEAVARICEAPENEKPALLVFDLNNLNAKPMTLIPKFKSKFKKAVSIIGFLNHLQGDLKMKAVEAGCDVGDAALGLLAEPAESSCAATAWKRKKNTTGSRRFKSRPENKKTKGALTSARPFLFAY